MNFGEVPGVAVNSKGHLFVFTATGRFKTVPVVDVWLKHSNGRRYDQLVYAMPGEPSPPGHVTSMAAVTPAPGD
jgi:hypothetical protein